MLGWFEEKYGSTQFYYLWRSSKYFADAENDPEIIGFYTFKATWEKTKEEEEIFFTMLVLAFKRYLMEDAVIDMLNLF